MSEQKGRPITITVNGKKVTRVMPAGTSDAVMEKTAKEMVADAKRYSSPEFAADAKREAAERDAAAQPNIRVRRVGASSPLPRKSSEAPRTPGRIDARPAPEARTTEGRERSKIVRRKVKEFMDAGQSYSDALAKASSDQEIAKTNIEARNNAKGTPKGLTKMALDEAKTNPAAARQLQKGAPVAKIIRQSLPQEAAKTNREATQEGGRRIRRDARETGKRAGEANPLSRLPIVGNTIRLATEEIASLPQNAVADFAEGNAAGIYTNLLLPGATNLAANVAKRTVVRAGERLAAKAATGPIAEGLYNVGSRIVAKDPKILTRGVGATLEEAFVPKAFRPGTPESAPRPVAGQRPKTVPAGVSPEVAALVDQHLPQPTRNPRRPVFEGSDGFEPTGAVDSRGKPIVRAKAAATGREVPIAEPVTPKPAPPEVRQEVVDLLDRHLPPKPAAVAPEPRPVAPEPVAPRPVEPSVTGVSNAANDAAGIATQKIVKPTSAEATATAQAKISSGEVDSLKFSEDVASGKVAFNQEAVALAKQGQSRLNSEVARTQKVLDDAIVSGDKDAIRAAQEVAESARTQARTHADNIQVGKGEWAATGRELATGVDLDTGDYAGVLESYRRSKGATDVTRVEAERVANLTQKSKEAQARVDELTAQNDVLKANNADLEAEATRLRSQPVRAARSARSATKQTRIADLDAEFANLLADIKKPTKAGGSVRGRGRQAGALDLGPLAERTGQTLAIFENRVRATGLRAADVIDGMVTNFRAAGIDVTSGQVAEAIRHGRIERTAPERIAALEGRRVKADAALSSGDLSAFAAREKAEYTGPLARELEMAQYESDKAAKQVRRLIEDAKPPKSQVGALYGKVSNVKRQVASTGDVSALLRQAGATAGPYPKEYAQAATRAARAALDHPYAATLDRRLKTGRAAMVRDKAGLYLADGASGLAGKGVEENFAAGRLLERMGMIPKVGKTIAKIGEGFEIHYVTMLNEVRANIFDGFVLANPNATLKELKDVAGMVNVMTGRGFGAVIDPLSKPLSAVMFAPRFAASRVQFVPLIVKNALKPSASFATRKMALRIAAGNAAFVYGIGSLLTAAGWVVNYRDPSKPDWLKARKGDQVQDIAFGVAGALRPFLAGKDDVLTKGADPEFLDRLKRTFIDYKLNPLTGEIVSAIRGKDPVGKPAFRGGPKEIAQDVGKGFAPLPARDAYGTFGPGNENTPKDAKILGGVLQLLGSGGSNYPEKKSKPKPRTGVKRPARVKRPIPRR